MYIYALCTMQIAWYQQSYKNNNLVNFSLVLIIPQTSYDRTERDF